MKTVHLHRVLRLETRNLYRHRLAAFGLDPLVLAFNFETIGGGLINSDVPGASCSFAASGGGTAVNVTAGLVGNAMSITGGTFTALMSGVPTSIRFRSETSFAGCFWVNVNSIGSTVDLLIWSASSQGYIIRIDGAGNVTFFSGNGVGYDSVASVNVVTAGSWFFVAFSRNHLTGEIFVEVSPTSAYSNLVSAASATYSADPALTQLTMTLPGGGLVDCMRLWNEYKNDTDFRIYYNGGLGISYPP